MMIAWNLIYEISSGVDMARIRTIKPTFWTDEDMADISEAACLLAIGLLNYADDEGYSC